MPKVMVCGLASPHHVHVAVIARASVGITACYTDAANVNVGRCSNPNDEVTPTMLGPPATRLVGDWVASTLSIYLVKVGPMARLCDVPCSVRRRV